MITKDRSRLNERRRKKKRKCTTFRHSVLWCSSCLHAYHSIHGSVFGQLKLGIQHFFLSDFWLLYAVPQRNRTIRTTTFSAFCSFIFIFVFHSSSIAGESFRLLNSKLCTRCSLASCIQRVTLSKNRALGGCVCARARQRRTNAKRRFIINKRYHLNLFSAQNSAIACKWNERRKKRIDNRTIDSARTNESIHQFTLPKSWLSVPVE